MNLPWIVALSVGLAVLGIGWLVFGYHLQLSGQIRRQRQFDQLDNLAVGAEYGPVPRPERPVVGASPTERILLQLTQPFQGSQAGQDDELRTLFARAGYRGAQPLAYFQMARFALVVILVLIFGGYALVDGTAIGWVKVFIAAALGYLAPKYILQYFAQRRAQKLANEIPMLIDYLRMMQSSGISFEQAMVLFTEEQRIGLPILASELSAVRSAVKSGRSQADALRNMADQIGLHDLRELVSLINDAERYGTGLQEPLKHYSVRLSEKRRFEMQEYVGKLATKMVMIMVVFLLPALLIITAGPGFLAIYRAFAQHLAG